MGKFVSKKRRRTNKNKEKRRRSSKKQKKNTTRKMRKIGGAPIEVIKSTDYPYNDDYIEAVQDEILSALEKINKEEKDYYENKEIQEQPDRIKITRKIDGKEYYTGETKRNTLKFSSTSNYHRDADINDYELHIQKFIKYVCLRRINAITQLVYDILEIEKEEYEYRKRFNTGDNEYGNADYYQGRTSYKEVKTFLKINEIIKRIKKMKDEEMINLVTNLDLNNFKTTNLGYFTNLVYVPDKGEFAKLRNITFHLFTWASKKADEAWEQAKSKYIGCYITPDVINDTNYKIAIKEYEREIGEIYSYIKYEPWKNWPGNYTRKKYQVYNDEPYKGKIECNSIPSIPGIATYIGEDTEE